MKKLVKIISFLIVGILATAAVGCSDGTGDKIDLTNAPDYSESEGQFRIWSYGATCDDWYMLNGKRYYFEQGSLQTPEHTQQYKDAGFNFLFIDYTFQEHPLQEGYDFEHGKLKKVMDMAYEQGLKCFVFQPEIHSLSNFEESRINPEKAEIPRNEGVYFKSQEAINEYVARILSSIKEHPAFAGVSLIDEPKYTKFDAIAETYKAVKFVCPDAYVMINILPYAANSNEHKVLYCGRTDISTDDAYAEYLNTYYEKVGKLTGYIQYDDYPILNDGILSTYLYNHQIVSNFAKEHNLERRVVTQTSTYSNRRAVKAGDMYFQLNISQAFGNKEFSYYTYYPTVNVNGPSLPVEEDYIVNRIGNPNPLYYTLKDFHNEMQFNAKALMNFDYAGMQFLAVKPLPNGMDYLAGLKNDSFSKLKGFDATFKYQSGGLVIVTELYDKDNDVYGYYIVNATDSAYASEAVVELDFGDYKAVQIYQFSKINNVGMNDGKIKVRLSTGGGAFVIPF